MAITNGGHGEIGLKCEARSGEICGNNRRRARRDWFEMLSKIR